MASDKNNSEHLIMQMSNIKDVLETAAMGIWRIIFKDGCKARLKASDEMLKLLGIDNGGNMTEEELCDWWYKRVYPDDIKIAENYMKVLSQGMRKEVTYRWIHPTLGVRYVRCGGVGYKGSDGTAVIEGYHYDVTEQMEQQMKDTFIADALAKTYSCLVYMDLEKDWYTSYMNTNPDVEKYIPKEGRVSEAMKIMPKKLCSENEYENLRKFTDLETLNERMKLRNSISIIFRGVFVKWIRFTLIVSDRHSDGTIHRMVATVKDISEFRDKELKRVEELRENIDANKSKTMMLQNMTHEIRTPLNAMFGFSQLLCMPDGCLSDEQKSEYFNYIYNSFNMLSMLVDDVMDIVDAEHGNYRIQKSNFKVNDICHNAIQMAELRLLAGVKMYFTSDVDDNYTFDSDGRRIQQVLVNFLTNACKHTINGEIHLHVSTNENPGRLTFSVTDTGEGVPAETAKDIFERYKKANNKVQGSGLGLHICSIIAQKLGAEIKLDQNYTDGARFLFII